MKFQEMSNDDFCKIRSIEELRSVRAILNERLARSQMLLEESGTRLCESLKPENIVWDILGNVLSLASQMFLFKRWYVWLLSMLTGRKRR